MLARHEGRQSSMIMAILVIVPQAHAALMAPWPGRQVQSSGRRPLLLIGFVVLPIRALLFALITEPMVLVAVQVLDGISGIMLGVLQPLTIADSFGRTGRFNLAPGLCRCGFQYRSFAQYHTLRYDRGKLRTGSRFCGSRRDSSDRIQCSLGFDARDEAGRWLLRAAFAATVLFLAGLLQRPDWRAIRPRASARAASRRRNVDGYQGCDASVAY